MVGKNLCHEGGKDLFGGSYDGVNDLSSKATDDEKW